MKLDFAARQPNTDKVPFHEIPLGGACLQYGQTMIRFEHAPSDWVNIHQHKNWLWRVSLDTGMAQAMSPDTLVVPLPFATVS